jgi:hypothetical protein
LVSPETGFSFNPTFPGPTVKLGRVVPPTIFAARFAVTSTTLVPLPYAAFEIVNEGCEEAGGVVPELLLLLKKILGQSSGANASYRTIPRHTTVAIPRKIASQE